MATAIHIITESSDHYNFCSEWDLNKEKLSEFIAEQLGDEVNYIDEVWANLDNGEQVEFDYDIIDHDFNEEDEDE